MGIDTAGVFGQWLLMVTIQLVPVVVAIYLIGVIRRMANTLERIAENLEKRG